MTAMEASNALAALAGNETAKRALQVAAAGGHTIMLIGNGVATELRALAIEKLGMDPEKVIAWPPCPCGNFGHKHLACRCTYAKIRAHVAKAPTAEMAVETFEPSMEEYRRVGALRHVDQDAVELLDMARQQRYLSVTKMVSIARTIAKLDGAETVRVEHMSEAIQGGLTLAMYMQCAAMATA